MGTTGIQIVIILAYISVLFGISWYVKRRAASSTEDYVLAGRRLTTPLIMVSIVGLAVGGASTIGVAEQAYKVGLSAGWYTAAWGIGAIVMGLTVAKKYRRLHITTVPELLERYYDRRSMVAGIACQVLVQLVVMSLQYVAGGAVLAALMPDIFTPVTGMFTSAVVFIGITLIGGMWSASQSNILNVTLQYIGITVAAFLIVAMAGGIDVVAIQAPTVMAMDFFSGVGPMTIVTWIVVLITVNISLQAIIQISLGAKDVQTARKGFVIGGLVMLPVGFVAALLGVIASEMYPSISPTTALPQLIMSLNPWIAGITLASLWAADVSTACNLLLSAATLYSHDIHKQFIDPQMSDKKYMAITRMSVLLLGLLTLGFALTISGIISTLMAGLSLMTAFAVIVLMTMYAPAYCSRQAAFYTIMASIIVLVAWMVIPAVRVLPHVIYAEWIVCSVTFCGISLVSKKSISTDGLAEKVSAPAQH
ncbi:sodium:solute symporter family protein [Megasphaera massiliensis]|uniref:Sodium:solute symporter family protein n=1 Tax=Megasphaera massiliensis TaxID=1232428 RepID=A0ABT1STR7_9FIRM|nr:sodium:solute symporter family protein [Megasphaera massiliensis]MCB6234181.1 sodium:solute symporter family protein [Megasphaera massiliensis]MCB6386563.1 sodium:solute symporter family protein [Megasphaera massiliensis]MCB6400654.1 sodium:solute symporter family protein [Megasphaera massiliensis]MCB6404968.1 sodium:solute symporter family protein [Megasphaera massiliensis]MCB7349669.1 sodium:solute symporter family protein [Megasphaera massiliensis]